MSGFQWLPGQRQTLTSDNKALEAVCFGPPPSTTLTIVLLHEGLGCIDLWRSFPESLSEVTGLGVFVYSRAGYGNSDPVPLPRPLDYMTREALEVLPGVLNAGGIERCVLAGHSDGASIAAIYAGSVQDFRVRGLILIAPHFFTEPDGLAAIREANSAYETTNLKIKLSKHHRNVDNAFRGWIDAWLDPGFEEWNIAEVIDYWRIPVLAIQGEQDQYGTLAQIQEIENRILSPLDIEILEECRHAPHIKQQARTLDAFKVFLQRLENMENAVVNV